MITEHDLVTLALYSAEVQSNYPELSIMLERLIYTLAVDKFPETTLRYLLELTTPQVYQ